MTESIIGSKRPILKASSSLLRLIESKLNNIKDLIVQRLSAGGLPRTADELLDFEKFAQERSCELVNAVTAAVLLGLNEDETFRTAAQAAFTGDGRFRNGGTRSTTVRLPGGGTVQLRTPYLARKRGKRRGRRRGVGRRGSGGSGVFPVLVCLGICWGTTPALASAVAREATDSSSYGCARESLAARGIALDVKVIRRLTMALGNGGLKVRQARIEEARQGKTTDEFKGKKIVVGVDGGRLRSRVPRIRGRRKNETNRRGFDCPWREPKCFVIYEIDEKGRKKRTKLPMYDATLGNCDAVFEIITAELKLRGARYASLLLFLADGAEWIWDRIPDLVKELGIDPRRVFKGVDFYHAVENLEEAAELRSGWNKKKRKRWVKRMKKLLWRGKVEKVIEEIGQLCVGRNAKALRTKCKYFVDRKDLMAYAKLRKRHLPIGSGSVESAVRRIVNLRLKGCGIFWLQENSEAMLYLRAHLKAGRWDEMVRTTFTHVSVAA
jgi:hypothetical protein